jgi:MFS family permease
MDSRFKKQLEKNISKYAWYKIFTKRVYLPLIAIQLVNVGKVTVGQLAIISAVTVVVSLLLQLPTGYIADKYGNKFAILLGCIITVPSPLFYLAVPNFWGGLIASLLFFGGYASQSGAIEAFIHDTLVTLEREHEYSKIMGRAQSYGLIGNVILLIMVPATYTINHSLPFILGFASLVAMLLLALSFTYPPRKGETKIKNPFAATKNILNKQNIALFMFAGVSLGVSYTSGNYRELAFQHVGIAVGLFGTLLAVSSVIGAILGRYIHIIDKFKPRAVYMFDLLFISSFLMLAGSTTNRLVVSFAFIMLAGYDRVHLIIFQAKLLENITHTYKATLLSALNVFSTLGQAGAVVILAKLIGFKGYGTGYVLFGLVTLGVSLFLWLLVVGATRQKV